MKRRDSLVFTCGLAVGIVLMLFPYVRLRHYSTETERSLNESTHTVDSLAEKNLAHWGRVDRAVKRLTQMHRDGADATAIFEAARDSLLERATAEGEPAAAPIAAGTARSRVP